MGGGDFLAVPIAAIGQELPQRGYGVFVPAPCDKAFGDLQVGTTGQLVGGKPLQESPQRGHSEVQFFVALGLGNVPSASDLKLCIRDVIRLGAAVLVGQVADLSCDQVLPHPPGLLPIAFGQPAFAQAEAGFDRQRVPRMVLDELLVEPGRLAPLLQVL